jgi:hypothetical protein
VYATPLNKLKPYLQGFGWQGQFEKLWVGLLEEKNMWRTSWTPNSSCLLAESFCTIFDFDHPIGAACLRLVG